VLSLRSPWVRNACSCPAEEFPLTQTDITSNVPPEMQQRRLIWSAHIWRKVYMHLSIWQLSVIFKRKKRSQIGLYKAWRARFVHDTPEFLVSRSQWPIFARQYSLLQWITVRVWLVMCNIKAPCKLIKSGCRYATLMKSHASLTQLLKLYKLKF